MPPMEEYKVSVSNEIGINEYFAVNKFMLLQK